MAIDFNAVRERLGLPRQDEEKKQGIDFDAYRKKLGLPTSGERSTSTNQGRVRPETSATGTEESRIQSKLNQVLSPSRAANGTRSETAVESPRVAAGLSRAEGASLLERSLAASGGTVPTFDRMERSGEQDAAALDALGISSLVGASGTEEKTPLERLQEEMKNNSSQSSLSVPSSFQSLYSPEEAASALETFKAANQLYDGLRRDTTEGGTYVRSSGRYQPTEEQRSQIEKMISSLQTQVLGSNTANAIERELAQQYIDLFQGITEKGSYAKLALSQFALGVPSSIRNTATGLTNMVGDIVSGGRLSEATKTLDAYFAEHPETLTDLTKGKAVYTPAIAEETGVRQGDLELYLDSAADRALQKRNYQEYGGNLNPDLAEFVGSNAYSMGAQVPGLLLTAGANSTSPMWKKTVEEAKKLGYLIDPKTGNVIKNLNQTTGGLLGKLADGESLKTALQSAFQGNFATYLIGASSAGGSYNELMRTEDYDWRNFLNAFGQGFAEYFTEGLFGFSDMASYERFFDNATGNGASRVMKGLLNWLSGGGEEALEEIVNAPLGELVNLATGKKSEMVDEMLSWNPDFQTGGFQGAKALVGENGVFNLEDMASGGLSGFVTGAIMGMAGSVASTYESLREGAGIAKTVNTLNRFVQEKLPEDIRPQTLSPTAASYEDVAAYTARIQNAIVEYAQQMKSRAEEVTLQAGKGEGTMLPTAVETDAQFSLESVDGRIMPVIDTKNDTRNYDAAESYLKTLVNTEHPFTTILRDAQPVYIGRDLPREYRGSEYTKTMFPEMRTVKMQAATNLDEMLLLAENGEWQENIKDKHRKDAANGWYRYNTEFAIPETNKKGEAYNTIYGGTLLIRNDADGKSYLYDLLDIKEKKTVAAPSSSTVKGRSEVSERALSPTIESATNTAPSPDSANMQSELYESIRSSSAPMLSQPETGVNPSIRGRNTIDTYGAPMLPTAEQGSAMLPRAGEPTLTETTGETVTESPSERDTATEIAGEYQSPGMLPTAAEAELWARMSRASTELERSGIQAGAREEDIQTAQRLSDALGREIRFYDGRTRQGAASVANGYYAGETIYINSRSRNPVAQIISHELTHSVEMANAYRDLSGIVMQRIRQTDGNLEELRREKRELYARRGVELAEDAEIDREIVAEYVEQHFLTDEESILELTRQNRTLGQRILDWLDRLLARLGNKDAGERVFILRARDAYANALRQTQAQTERQETLATMRGLREDYAAGRITDEEFDEALDAVMEEESLSDRSMLDEQYSIQETKDGKRYVKADRQVIYGNDPEAWGDQVEGYINRKIRKGEDVALATDDGDTLLLTSATEGKSSFRNYVRDKNGRLRPMSDAEYETKLNAQTHIDELAQISERGKKTIPDEGGVHGAFAENGWNYRTAYFQDFDGKYYRVTLSVAQNSNGNVVYNVGDIQERTPPSFNGSSAENSGAQWGEALSDTTIAQRNTGVNSSNVGKIERRSFPSFSGFSAENSGAQWGKASSNTTIAQESTGVNPSIRDRNETDTYSASMLPTAADGTQYSISEDFAEEIDAWDGEGRPDGEVFILGSTGDVLQGLGAMEQDIYLRSEKVSAILQKHPEMTITEIKRIPEILDDPVLVLKSRNTGRGRQQNTRLVLFGTVRAENGQPVLTVLDLRPVENGLAIDDMQKVTSVYTKDNNPMWYVQNSDVMYADKNRTIPLLRTIGFQMPIELQQSGSMGSISYHRQNVNLQGVPFHEVVEVQREDGIRESAETDTYGAPMLPTAEDAPQYSVSEDGGQDAENDRATDYDDRGERWDGTFQQTGGTEAAREAEETRRERNETYQNYPWMYGTGESVTEAMEDMEAGREAIPGMLPRAAKDIVESLRGKARDYVIRGERYLLDKTGAALGVPGQAGCEYLKDVVREVSNEYLEDGRVSGETVDRLFRKAYEEGMLVNRAYYEQYEDLRDNLRHLELTISPEDSADIPDFDSFLASNAKWLHVRTGDNANLAEGYRELQKRWPALFGRERQDTPAEQLQRIAQVAKSFETVRHSLDGYDGQNANAFRRLAKHDFEAAIQDAVGELHTVRRYLEDRAAQARTETPPATAEEVAALWRQVKDARRKYERVLARHLLTAHDEMQVGRLMRGEMELQHLDPAKDNVRGITAVYEARQTYEDLARQIRIWNQARKAALRQEADGYLQTANDWHDKRAGILYSRETMERNIRDIVPDEELAEEIIRTYFTPVHEAAAEASRTKNRYRDRVRELKLSRKVAEGNLVSEAHAVQLLGEAEDNIRMLERSRGRVKARDGKSLEEWRGVVKKLWEENPKLDAEKIRAAVGEFRKIYDELFEQMNEARIRNGYEPVNYRSGYFPHFQPGNGDGILAQFGKALGITTEVSALPTTINGLTHSFRPGIRWLGNAEKRLGFNTVYDAVEGFDRYIEGVSDVIYQTDNIQRLRALASQIRYRTGDEGIRRQVDAVWANPNITEEDKQNRIEKIHETGRYALSNFAVELEEYTNLLANKKSRADRNMEQALGRHMYNLMKALESRVAANMVAINPASWLTNFVPLAQGGALLDHGMLLHGMWDTLKAYKESDGIVDRSAFLTNRRGSDPIVRAWTEASSAVASKPMEWIDSFVADSLVRARYRQNLGKGMSEAAAMQEADAFAASVMADRSKGAMPTLFYRANPLTKLFTQFQLEVNNTLSFVLKDIPREKRKKGLAALAAALFQFCLNSWLYNELYEFIIGRRPALDPIGMLNDTVGDLTGWELPNLVELGVGAASGNLPSFQVEKAGLGEAGVNLVENLAEQTPFIGGLIGGGRLPVSSAIPNIGNLWNAVTNEDWSTEKRLQEFRDEILEKPLLYLGTPFGGGQIKKIYEAIEGVIQGGSYSVNADGERELQFPIYRDTAGERVKNSVQGALFGKTSLPTGRDWIERSFDTLSAKQTAVYEGLLDAGVPGKDAYALIQELRDAEKTETESRTVRQRKLVEASDISGDGKSVVYYGLLASDGERELMDALAGQDADMGEVAAALMKIKDAGTMTGAAASCAKRDAIAEAGLDEAEKIQIYRYAFGERQENGGYVSSRDDDIEAFQEAGLDFEAFLEAQNQYSTINEQYDSAAEKSLEFARWADTLPYTSEQAEQIKESFRYYSQVPAEAGRYEKFVDAGLSTDDAYELASVLAELEPEAGKEAVSNYQRYEAILDSGLRTQAQLDAIGAIMGTDMQTESGNPSQYAKLLSVLDAGADLRDWLAVARFHADAESDRDADGKIVESAKEKVVAYIDDLQIADEAKDALYLCYYAESGLSDAPWYGGGWSLANFDWSGIWLPKA